MVSVINISDYKKVIGLRPFVALPQEEIDRLFASIEIEEMDYNQATADTEKMILSLFIVVHFNYSWLTYEYACSSKLNVKSMGFSDFALPQNHSGLFLDESLSIEADRILKDNLLIKSGYTLRLAGLIYDISIPHGKPYLGIVYVSRLHQNNSVCIKKNELQMDYFTTGELCQFKDRFESRSKIVIEHVVAL
jgi:predicted NUDIX family phosphoesterase